MQLCALEDEELVFAYKAVKQKDYRCLECREIVRLRSGNHRQAHFFHTQPNRQCKQHSKGLPHLNVQYYLKNSLPKEQGEIECRFPEIGRIADVAWHEKKIIFEVQYSPISAHEVKARNLSYQSLGYRVIWILSDARYNQITLSEAEDILLKLPHYFTNMNEQGNGFIYDQFSLVKGNMRTYRLPKLSVDLSCPYVINDEMFEKSSHSKELKTIIEHRKPWEIGFDGDAFDYLSRVKGTENSISDMFYLEFLRLVHDMPESYESFHFTLQYIQNLMRQWFIRPYKIVLQALLERASRT